MRQVFALAPAHLSPIWMLWVAVPLAVVFLGLHFWFDRQASRVRVNVSDSAVEITGGLYGRSVPLAALDGDAARTVSLADPRYRLRWRTNGAALPGYRAGWFRAGEIGKVLVFVTPSDRVAYIPTDRGYALLLGVADPDALITSVRKTKAARGEPTRR